MTYINRNVCSVAAVAAAVVLYGDYCIKERHTCILLLNTKILSSHHNYYGDYNQTSEIFQLKLMTNDCVYSEQRMEKSHIHRRTLLILKPSANHICINSLLLR